MSHGKSLAHSPADLKLESFDYDLPPHLIAERPVPGRHHSKLLVYDEESDTITHSEFKHLAQFLPADATLVANQSRVFPCRFLGQKDTGAKVEVFLLAAHPDPNGHYRALIRSGSKKNVGDRYLFKDALEALLVAVENDGTFKLAFNRELTLKVLEELALVPIPPYIRGGVSDEQDLRDYQTIYAKNVGSVAAPTAGLHFTPEVFESLATKGIERAFVTLHVGMGTFAPVKSEIITDHQMHTEEFTIDPTDYERIKQSRARFAVGTTSLRVLESVFGRASNYSAGQLASTNIFLHPGVAVNSIAGLITNFHLPKSSLLMLVSALIGREKVLALYREAIEHEYRFFSYGDAMLIKRQGARE